MLKKHGRYNEHSHFKMLEIGCGEGYLLQSWNKWFPNATIFSGDRTNSIITSSEKRLSSEHHLIQFDAHHLPFKNQQLNVVIAIQVIEHLSTPVDYLKECARVLETGGFLILSTPNPAGAATKVLKNKWQGYHQDHISLNSPQKWRQIITESGFQILNDGTTGLTGFKILQKLPFALVNWIPMAIFGYFPWYHGESYMVIAKKT